MQMSLCLVGSNDDRSESRMQYTVLRATVMCPVVVTAQK
jgi:hypothetical protein